MDPTALRIGPFSIYWYGLLIVMGAILAALLAALEARRRGEDPEHVWNLLTWCLLLGIIGARLYHVFSSPAGGFTGWDYYRRNPIEIIAFWKGGFRGLGIYGAVAGGLLAVLLYARFTKISFLRWADIIAPGVLLAQAIGRWGNYINQELYGPPTTLPWGITIDGLHRFGPYIDLNRYPLDTRFHPTFLYESLWNLIGFGLLFWLARRYAHALRDGDIFASYILYYSVGRLWIEIFRPDAWTIAAIPTAQIIALLLMAGSIIFLFWRRRDWTPPEPWYTARTAAPPTPPAPATPEPETAGADVFDLAQE